VWRKDGTVEKAAVAAMTSGKKRFMFMGIWFFENYRQQDIIRERYPVRVSL
jgi:hypothetical protein